MTPTGKTTKTKGKAPKGSKAACEAAGWKFAPIPSIGTDSLTYGGKTISRRVRYEGRRGTIAIPPAASGIEPRQFGGSILAVRWAVERLSETARQPDEAPAGMVGVRLLLTAALASGEICGGSDDTPVRPDAELLSICRDAIEADKTAEVCRAAPCHDANNRSYSDALGRVLKGKRDVALALPKLHATTREGLLQKARAALVLQPGCYITTSMTLEVFKSLAVDLIHLVPTLIDERGRVIDRPRGDTDGVA